MNRYKTENTKSEEIDSGSPYTLSRTRVLLFHVFSRCRKQLERRTVALILLIATRPRLLIVEKGH